MANLIGLAVHPDDFIVLEYIASEAPTRVQAWVKVQFEGSKHPQYHTLGPVSSFTTDRTAVLVTGQRFQNYGTIVAGGISGDGGTLKRGQFYVRMLLDSGTGNGTPLASGYFHRTHSISLGELVEPGPGGGEGFLTNINMATDSAGNTDTLIGMGVTNGIRKIYGFVLKYNAAAVAATRTIVVTIRGPFGSEPTGYGTTTTRNVWTSPTLTLTTGEEGMIYVSAVDGKEYVVVNDNGTLTVASTATAPSPFPILAKEADSTLAFVVTVTAGEATDVYNADILVEEWLVL